MGWELPLGHCPWGPTKWASLGPWPGAYKIGSSLAWGFNPGANIMSWGLAWNLGLGPYKMGWGLAWGIDHGAHHNELGPGLGPWPRLGAYTMGWGLAWALTLRH